MIPHPSSFRPRAARFAVALAVAVVLAVVGAGCTGARLTNVWRDPQYSGSPASSMLVVSRERDATQRRLTEDALAGRLRDGGVAAVSAYTLFPDAAPTQAEMSSAMRDRGLDAALVIRPLPTETNTEWVPGWNQVEPRTYYDPWRERSRTVVVERHHPGHRVVEHVQRLELTCWAGEARPQMVWAGTLEDADPGSRDQLRDDLAANLVPGLRRAGFLAPAGRHAG